MFDFGLRIKDLREQYKMSQEQLGRRLERSKSVISSYENNIKIPPLEILTKMAVIFNVSLDYLVGIDKAEMIAIEGLTPRQKEVLQKLVFEFKEKGRPVDGLSERQQEILSSLMKEFSKRNNAIET